MANDTNKPNFSAKLPASLKVRFHTFCIKKGISMTEVLIKLISEYIEKQDQTETGDRKTATE